MIGGTVIEVCEHPTERDRFYINVVERSYTAWQELAIYVKRTPESEQIEVGDNLWWQGDTAYWTPLAICRMTHEDRLSTSSRYDIPIPRVGYSGVRHPYHEVPDDPPVDD